MMHEVAADRPVAGLRGEPRAALSRPSLRPEDVRLNVVREEILRVAWISAVDRALGGFGVARLLMREAWPSSPAIKNPRSKLRGIGGSRSEQA